MNFLCCGIFPVSSKFGASMMLILETARGEDAKSTTVEKDTARIPEVLIATAEHGHNYMLKISPC